MGKPKESNKMFEKPSRLHGVISKEKHLIKEYKEKKQLEKIACALKKRPSFRMCVPRNIWLEKEIVTIVPKEKAVKLSKELLVELNVDGKIFKKTPTKTLIAKARLEMADMNKSKTTTSAKRALRFTRSNAIDLNF